MTRGILILGFMLLPCLAQTQEAMTQAEFASYAEDQLAEAGRLWQEREFRKAVAILEELAAHREIRDLGSLRPTTLYNLACGYALLGRKDEALAHLREATEAGYADVAQIEGDPDLAGIRAMPAFRDLLRRLRAEGRFWENPVLNTPYRENVTPEEKVAGLSKLWSEVRYNFVFFERVPDVDWDSLYVAYLQGVRQTTSTLEYYRILQEMTAQLQDGHTRVNIPPELYDQACYRPAIRTCLVEKRVLIVEVGSGAKALAATRIQPGMEIILVEGIPVREYAARAVLPYVCASTPQARDVWAYDYDLLLGPKGEGVELELRDDNGRMYTTHLKRTEPVMVRPPTNPEVHPLAGNITYVAVKSFADPNVVGGFDSLFAGIAESEGLILDLRDNGGGNSAVGYTLLGYLTERPFSIEPCASRDYRPIRRALGLKNGLYEEPAVEWPASGPTLFQKPVAVLIGPRTGSAAEDFCVAFRVMQRGKLVGEATAGSTGQPLVFGLPGGGNATVCTAYCRYPDGTEFVGVGIEPDIEVHPTVRDVRDGRDATLEAATDYVRRSVRSGEIRSGRADSEMVDPPAISTPLQADLESWLSSHGKPPADYVVGLFSNHDVVLLGEQHRIRHDVLLVQELLPRLHAAGVYVLATEFARRVDQALLDSLVTAHAWDETLGREIVFRHFMPWGYREYVDVLKAAWRVNHDRIPGTPPLRVIGINNAPDFSYFKSEADWQNPEIRELVYGNATEADWAAPVLAAVKSGQKVLVHCGIHHALTGYRQPVVQDGSFLGFSTPRFGNYLREAIGARAITVYLHAPWNGTDGYGVSFVHPAGGRIDAFMLARKGGPFAVGFDVADSPLANLPIDNSVYKHGYQPFTMADFCDGWIYTKPVSEFEPVAYIEDWINESNLERARLGAMNPRWRTYSVAHLNAGCLSYKDDFHRFFGNLR